MFKKYEIFYFKNKTNTCTATVRPSLQTHLIVNGHSNKHRNGHLVNLTGFDGPLNTLTMPIVFRLVLTDH